jgi:hypothetical protein
MTANWRSTTAPPSGRFAVWRWDGRKNWLFAGSDAGGQRAAAIYSLIETCKLNGIDPEASLPSSQITRSTTLPSPQRWRSDWRTSSPDESSVAKLARH